MLDPDSIRIHRPVCLHTVSIWMRAVLCDSAPGLCVDAHSLHTVWSSRETALNPDRGSGFSASVESPNVSALSFHPQLPYAYVFLLMFANSSVHGGS